MLDDRRRLIDDVLLITLGDICVARGKLCLDPTGIEIDVITASTAHIRKMLNRQTQPPRPRWTKHQPVRALWEQLRRVVQIKPVGEL